MRGRPGDTETRTGSRRGGKGGRGRRGIGGRKREGCAQRHVAHLLLKVLLHLISRVNIGVERIGCCRRIDSGLRD